MSLLAYFPELALNDEEGGNAGFLEVKACMKLGGARRKEGQDVLELPVALAGRPMEVYITVVSDDGKKVANSQYLDRMATI